MLTWIEKEKSLARRGFGDSVRWIGDFLSWLALVDGGGGALGEELTDWTGGWKYHVHLAYSRVDIYRRRG